MNRKLKIYQLRTTKFLSISPKDLSGKKESSRMTKTCNFLIENGQKRRFSFKKHKSISSDIKRIGIVRNIVGSKFMHVRIKNIVL
ncbi:MAG: hypothetical protein R6U96_18500 [Promethearchaeia archaeon]